MYRNLENLSAEECLDKVNEEFPPATEDIEYPKYIIFAVEESRRGALFHVMCRIHWDRNNVPMLSRDCSWHHTESPNWITGNE